MSEGGFDALMYDACVNLGKAVGRIVADADEDNDEFENELAEELPVTPASSSDCLDTILHFGT